MVIDALIIIIWHMRWVQTNDDGVYLMFDNIRHWLHEMATKKHLFSEDDNPLLRTSIAALLYHVIISGNEEDIREWKLFTRFFDEEVVLSEDKAAELYSEAKRMNQDYTTCLQVINAELKDNTIEKKEVMEYINKIIALSGVKEEEIQLFEEAKRILFPNTIGSEQDLLWFSRGTRNGVRPLIYDHRLFRSLCNNAECNVTIYMNKLVKL